MNAFSLYELNQHLRRVISFNLNEAIWIKAEIADVNFHKNNCYLSLVEKDDFQLKARADAAIWANSLQKIQLKIAENLLAQLLQKGSQVLILVQVEYQEQYGLKLAIQDIDLNFSLGKLEQNKIETWAKLEKAELTTKNKELILANLCKRIAVISSPEAAGYQDFIQQLNNNSFGFQFRTELFAATMQGAAVGKDMLNQIRLIEYKKAEFDCVVVVRGGGAKLDLAAFNEFITCGALANSPLPVLTGIGHDIDVSLSDKIAHTSLKTPTAVADFLINRVLALQTKLEQLKYRQKNAFQYQLLQKQNKLEQLKSRFAQNQLAHILASGFVILLDKDGNRISKIAEIKNNTSIFAKMSDGTVELQPKNRD